MNELIFGKDKTNNIVSVEPSEGDICTLFVQDAEGVISKKEVPLSHWILFTRQHSPKMHALAGSQFYSHIIEYDSRRKYEEILNSAKFNKLETFPKMYFDGRVSIPTKEAFMLRSGVTYFKDLKVKDVSVLSFDLEHTFGVGDEMNPTGHLLLISNTYRDSKGNITKRLFAHDEFKSEGAMLTEWCAWVRANDPSIVLGHNIFGHDFKILEFARKRARTVLNLGRDNSPMWFERNESKFRKDGSQAYDYQNAHIYGREIVDTFFLAMKYDTARNYDSYGLKAIIKHEGLEKAGRVHYDASTIVKNHSIPEEWTKIKAYAIDDADDALALYDLMIAPFFYSTQSIPRPLQQVINTASGSQINGIMVRGYLQQGHSIARSDEAVPFEGAISFGVPGIHKNVLRFDVSSLYPSVIRQYKIYSVEKDPQQLFLKMVEYFTLQRLEYKRLGKIGDRYFQDLSDAFKILINSMYGFLGANKLNYNFPLGASLVTRYGREILKKAILWATGKEYQGDIESLEVEHEAS